MLLYSKRPRMIPDAIPVVLNKENFPPPAESRDPHPVCKGDKKRPNEHCPEGRINLEAAPDEKLPEADALSSIVFGEQ